MRYFFQAILQKLLIFIDKSIHIKVHRFTVFNRFQEKPDFDAFQVIHADVKTGRFPIFSESNSDPGDDFLRGKRRLGAYLRFSYSEISMLDFRVFYPLEPL
jgi:hypothetical protein